MVHVSMDRLAGDHLYGTLLFAWLSPVITMMVSICVVLFPTRCLGCDLDFNWVSFWGFFLPTLQKIFSFYLPSCLEVLSVVVGWCCLICDILLPCSWWRIVSQCSRYHSWSWVACALLGQRIHMSLLIAQWRNSLFPISKTSTSWDMRKLISLISWLQFWKSIKMAGPSRDIHHWEQGQVSQTRQHYPTTTDKTSRQGEGRNWISFDACTV